MKLVFATNNRHKLNEIRAILGDKIELLSLNDINFNDIVDFECTPISKVDNGKLIMAAINATNIT